MRRLRVKCKMGKRANGSWSAFIMLHQRLTWMIESVKRRQTITHGTIEIERVTIIRRHFVKLIFVKPFLVDIFSYTIIRDESKSLIVYLHYELTSICSWYSGTLARCEKANCPYYFHTHTVFTVYKRRLLITNLFMRFIIKSDC